MKAPSPPPSAGPAARAFNLATLLFLMLLGGITLVSIGFLWLTGGLHP